MDKGQDEPPFDPYSYGIVSNLNPYAVDCNDATKNKEEQKEKWTAILSRIKQEQTGDPNAKYHWKNNMKCLPKKEDET